MSDEKIDQLSKKLHEHDLRINSIEIKHDTITINVSDLKADRKRIMWIIVTVLITSLTYAGLSGLEGFINVR